MTQAVQMPDTGRHVGRPGRILLWILALAVMLTAAAYQRRTGPTYPVSGSLSWAGEALEYELLRSHETTAPAPVVLPYPGDGPVTLYWRRYPTTEAFRALPLRIENDTARGALPVQPAAGKVEYYLDVATPDGTVRIPSGDESIILRYKGPVPLGVLLPHVLLMFLSMLVGVRTGLAALVRTGETRTLAWITLAGLTVGGMILGPVVQEYAFGEFWTGVPLGWDLTDNKTLVMWLGWLVACLVLGLPRRPVPSGRARAGRAMVLGAAALMLVVYLIPHSLAGSQLDYEQLDRGVPAEDAVTTG